jgi:hypothetical protein
MRQKPPRSQHEFAIALPQCPAECDCEVPDCGRREYDDIEVVFPDCGRLHGFSTSIKQEFSILDGLSVIGQNECRKEAVMTRSRRWLALLAGGVLLTLTFVAGWFTAVVGFGAAVDPALLPEMERQFAERMRNVSMVGYFTLDGREDTGRRPDRYDISSIEKVGEDRWRFNARIGEKDITLPVTVTMRWVDDTPMILLTDLTIPALGTFSARVFFYGDRYAGTWQHGDRGGHLFGHLEP